MKKKIINNNYYKNLSTIRRFFKCTHVMCSMHFKEIHDL